MLLSLALRASGTGSSSTEWVLILTGNAQKGSCFRSFIILVKDDINNQLLSQSEEGTFHCSTALRPAEPFGLLKPQALCQARGCGRAPHRCPHVQCGRGAERCDPHPWLCPTGDAAMERNAAIPTHGSAPRVMRPRSGTLRSPRPRAGPGSIAAVPGAGGARTAHTAPAPRRPLAARPAPRATTVSVRACAGAAQGIEGRAGSSRESTRLYQRVGGHGASFSARPPAAQHSR